MSEVEQVKVPDIGNYDQVPVIEVLVAVGDTVKADQGLVTLESDKATMEVPAPFAGVVREIKVKLGDQVSEGVVVALIEAAQATTESAAAKPAPQPAVAANPASGAESLNAAAEKASAPVATQDASAGPAPSPAPSPAAAASDPPVLAHQPADVRAALPGQAPYASPAVRAMARELGVDLSKVSGSARGGRIVDSDVKAFVKNALARAPAAGGGRGLSLLPWPEIDFAKFGAIESKPLSKIKRLSGANLARNWAMIPHVTQHDEADITELEAFRKAEVARRPEVKLSPLVFQIKAVVAALRQFPNFNASLDPGGEQLIVKKYFHVGIAVDTPDGLVVPVIRDCDRKGLLELAEELGKLSGKARERKLSPAEMSGGCFSISSLGGIGGSAFTPIVNAPEVAILGVSRAAIKPVWDGAAFAPRLMLPLSLSYDHRVIDGAEAARFTSHLAQLLGDVRRLLL